MLFENVPYTNFHDLNLDWVMKVVKDFLDKYTHIQELIASGEKAIEDLTEEELALMNTTADDLKTQLNTILLQAVAQFIQEADEKTAQTIASIPADYTTLSDEVAEIFDTLNIFNFNKLPYTTKPNTTVEGITWSTLDHGVIKAVGQTTLGTNAQNIFYFTSLPVNKLIPGTKVLLYQNSSNPASLYMELFTRKSGGSLSPVKNFKNKNGFTSWVIPADTTAILFRAFAAPNVALNATIFPAIVTLPEHNNYFTEYNVDQPLGYDQFGEYWAGSEIDLNNITDNSFHLLTDAGTYLNKPGDVQFGFLQSVTTGRWHLQLLYNFFGGAIYKRRGTPDGGTWEAWQSIEGGGETYVTNNYNFPVTQQTVNLTATPSITADSNQYLVSTGDTTDRTADILAMLTANKCCRLGPGVFYVNNLQMPDYSRLTGCGFISCIKLADNVSGAAVKMGSYCTIDNVRFDGANGVPTITETVGNRHAIVWSGNYQASTSDTKWRSMIHNVWIRWFTGGGINCYNTGYGTNSAILVENVWILRCGAGINISFLSEFNKFVNVASQECYYGCINNGGNNTFVSCDFSSNIAIGMLLDNSQGQSPNNGHGSAIGCIFNHTFENGVANSGTGIVVKNVTNGFIFDGCQIFFSKINLENADGFQFSNCNFGYSNCNITVNGGGVIVFNGNMHQQKAPITVTNNSRVHFINCYDRSNGNLITA